MCEIGTYGGDGSTSCEGCASGTYSEGGAGVCSICRAGTFSVFNEITGYGASECTVSHIISYHIISYHIDHPPFHRLVVYLPFLSSPSFFLLPLMFNA